MNRLTFSLSKVIKIVFFKIFIGYQIKLQVNQKLRDILISKPFCFEYFRNEVILFKHVLKHQRKLHYFEAIIHVDIFRCNLQIKFSRNTYIPYIRSML